MNSLSEPGSDHPAMQGQGGHEVCPPATEVKIDHGVPVFLDQLTDALRLGQTTSPEISRSAVKHGHDLLLQGSTVSQVVHDYGDVCQAITELAVELNAPITTGDFRTLNRCLDDAIAGAVTEYGRERNQSGIDRESARASERLGFFAHELRNLMNTALMAFEVLKTGNVGVGGARAPCFIAASWHRTDAPFKRDLSMLSRKLAELATDVDDASLTVEELQHEPDVDAHEKLNELHKTLEDASNTIDELASKDD